MSIVDTHAHLDLPEFDEDRDEVLRRALESGVHAIMLIGFNPTSWSATREAVLRYPYLLRSAGVHPNDASMWSDDVREMLTSELAAGKVVAVGECGLDFYRDRANPSQQLEAFDAQVEIAAQLGLPIIIHQRAAEDEVLEMLRRRAPVPGIMHAFNGGPAFARSCLDLGLHLGIGGIATFPRSSDVRAAIEDTRLDRLIVETDAPYLAPQSWRGTRNEPAYVTAAVEVIAQVKGMNIDAVAEQTTANARRLLGPKLDEALRAGREAAKCV